MQQHAPASFPFALHRAAAQTRHRKFLALWYHSSMKTVIYTRKSTEQDERQALSLEAQLRELRQFAAEEQLQIVASFEEAKTAKEPESNRSGRTSSHRKFLAFL